MLKITKSDIKDMSIEERIGLVEEIWDSIVEERPEEIPLTAEQKEELDRRCEEYKRNPKAGSSWEEVKARIKGKE